MATHKHETQSLTNPSMNLTSDPNTTTTASSKLRRSSCSKSINMVASDIEEVVEIETNSSSSSSSCRRRRNGLTNCLVECKEVTKRCLPVLNWLPKYKLGYLAGDIMAGVTVGCTAVPQVMAYANLAGLKPQYGLYSSFIAPLVYILLGSCYQVTIGPSAIISLVAFESCGENYPECVILSSFWGGLFALIFALCRLGAIVSLIAEPVTIGFTAGAAITVVVSQLKSLFGLSGTTNKADNNFIGYLTFFFGNLNTISIGDSILGVSCVLVLFLFQKLGRIIQVNGTSRKAQLTRKLVWFLSISRNVLVVTVTTIIAYLWTTFQSSGAKTPFKLIGNVPAGFPSFAIPSFLLPIKSADDSNGTILTSWSTFGSSGPEDQDLHTFSETWSILKTGPLVIALIAILQNVSIAKVYGHGQRIDGTQEMISVGICNIAGSFFSAQPVSGSFSRSAVNEASGVRTSLSGLFTSAIILLSLGILTPAFTFIPKASLAAIIICALLALIEYDTFVPMWKISKLDVLTCLATFISSLLLGMEYGIGIGCCASIGILLYKSLSSKLVSKLVIDPKTKLQYILLKPMSGPLQFPTIDVLRSHINFHVLEYKDSHHIIVLDCLHWTYFDYSGISAIGSIIKGLEKHKKYLVLQNCWNIHEWIAGLKSVGINDYKLFCTTDEDADATGEDNATFDLSQLFSTVLLPLINTRQSYQGNSRRCIEKAEEEEEEEEADS